VFIPNWLDAGAKPGLFLSNPQACRKATARMTKAPGRTACFRISRKITIAVLFRNAAFRKA
jgi:hypothetical protein